MTSDQSAVFLRGYLSYLANHGWDVTLIASDDGRLQDVGRAEGIRTIAIPMRREPSPLRDVVSLVRLLAALRALRPDVLIYSTPKAALLGAIAGWLLRVRVRVYELWGLRHETETGAKRAVLRQFERVIGCASTAVVADSASLARLAEQEGVALEVETVGSGSALGVDTRRFDRESEDLPPVDDAAERFLSAHAGVPCVAFVGRINRDKGVDTLIEAFRSLHDQGRVVALLVVGPEEDRELGRALADVAGQLPLHVVGAVSDPRPYMRRSVLLCLPTLREGFGQVIIEAAALGLPAVTTTATGARDAVVDGKTGLLVPTRDAEALAEAVWKIASEPQLADRLGEAARQRAIAEFDTDVVWPLHLAHMEAMWSKK
ncbi:MAG: glycosyltransferase family 4 protein [Propionibacteriales bacterium]|nr:glycosyltransferase family 4 protein [Propionibacteriales bacterium]